MTKKREAETQSLRESGSEKIESKQIHRKLKKLPTAIIVRQSCLSENPLRKKGRSKMPRRQQMSQSNSKYSRRRVEGV